MSDLSKSIEALTIKINQLNLQQNEFAVAIHKLKVDLERLKSTDENVVREVEETVKEESLKIFKPIDFKEEVKEPEVILASDEPSLEKYIGENLISKLGILVTVIGAIIGAKYAIDKNLMSPIVRIFSGYILGLVLMGLAFKLKKKYHNYSSVLLSGSIAIIYFISYAAYAYYGLLSREIAFVMMVLFTVFTVFQAIRYNRQFIALLGLVGAYGVPFLLSNNSGNIQSLFVYILIINIGILFISVSKNWKRVSDSAFGLTWSIYSFWLLGSFSSSFSTIALIFGVLFFILFYAVFLSFKVFQKEYFKQSDIVVILLNNFIFFSAGYYVIQSFDIQEYLTLFALANMVLHIIVAIILKGVIDIDKRLILLIIGMAMLFLSLAIPIQFDGPWLPLFWMIEALVLYWVGYRHKASFYGVLSLPLLVFGILALIAAWQEFYYQRNSDFYVLLNPMFLVTMFSTSVLYIIYTIHVRENDSEGIKEESAFSRLLLISLVLLAYGGLLFEIISIFDVNSSLNAGRINRVELNCKKTFAIQFFSICYVLGLSLIAWYKSKSEQIAYFTLIANGLILIVFVCITLPFFQEVNEMYLDDVLTFSLLGGRYLTYLMIAGVLLLSIKNQSSINSDEFKFYEIVESVCWIVALIVGSYELMYWSAQIGGKINDKLGLTIFFGIFALTAIVVGIWKSKPHLRIGAFCLLGFALLKLFFFDIAHFTTITKTITFLSIGITLLLISFLYNKYTDKISD